MVRSVQRLLLWPLRMVVGAAVDVLSRLDGALTRLADEAPQVEPADADEKARAGSRSDVLLPGRGAGTAGLDDIRRRLLANTPRPDDTPDDE